MPLGIVVDSDGQMVWYVSTKRGVLGSYDLKQNKFIREHVIPLWNSREDQTGFSQVWSVKINDNNNNEKLGGVEIWFTDTQQNAIWRYTKSSQSFEMYKIPGSSSLFGTIYPISLEFNSKGNEISFVGTYSPSIWIGNISKMRNGTSEGISQVPIPINSSSTFNGIDPPTLLLDPLEQIIREIRYGYQYFRMEAKAKFSDTIWKPILLIKSLFCPMI